MPNLDKDYYLDKAGLVTLINELETNVVAEAYSSSATYALGDYCIHDNKLYRCTTAITTAESWTSGHWSQVLVGNEIKNKSDENVKQTASTANSNFEVLFSYTADNTTRTEGARKSNKLIFNPSTGNLGVNILNGVTIRDITNNAGFHNSIYRGKSLGTSVSADQYAQISAGTFDDMFIGDYWTISTTINGTTTDINYVIAGFDYYINPYRNTEHHLILVPSDIIGTARMCDTDTTYPQGYFASEMYQTTLPAYKTGIQNAFGSSHTYYVYRFYPALISPVGQAIRQGYVNDDYLFFMSEAMVSGSGVWSTSGYEAMADRTILPLFALNPASAVLSTTYWLMTVASPTQFSTVTPTGAVGFATASTSAVGIRPAFVIYGGSNA